jgi:hypothetical protein
MVLPVSTAAHYPGSLVRRDEWESTEDWYDPHHHYANFVVEMTGPTRLPAYLPMASLERNFGPPAKSYLFGPYRVLVWHKNLLYHLG